jgi:hypothetical protein
MAGRSEGRFVKGGDIWDYHFRCIVKDKKEVKRLDHKNHCRIGTALIATASVGTIVSLFGLYYGFLYQYWVIVWCSLCLFAIIFIDLWKVSLHEKQEA